MSIPIPYLALIVIAVMFLVVFLGAIFLPVRADAIERRVRVPDVVADVAPRVRVARGADAPQEFDLELQDQDLGDAASAKVELARATVSTNVFQARANETPGGTRSD